jgi:hypothetical protein
MLKITLCAISLGFAAWSFAAEPVIDNERVTVWDTMTALPPAQHDFVAVSLSRKGTAIFGHKGDVPGGTGVRTVVIELKDHALAPIANTSGFPLAFPRPHAKKLLENDRVILWNYVWRPGVPTPMHFHDKDALVVYEAAGALQSTAPNGKSVVTEYKFAQIRFNSRDRVHSELLVRGQGQAVITELK